jgi:hypothetical protein
MSDTYKPTAEIASNAKRAIGWIEEGHAGSGFTSVGRARATQLANRESVSFDTVKRMYSFLARHEVDKKGKDFNNTSKPSAGRVAWDAWGGDAGLTWAKRIVEAMNDKSTISETASAFFGITKSEKQADGTLMVTGVATDNTLDVDEQICDPEWLKNAMPDWFRWGNIREQHSNIAAGVATEYEAKGDQHWITARVVDPASVKKVESGVLKGFSIGIRSPRVIKDNKAAGGRIVDGQIVEVSLVDRPANPACTLSLAKTIDGEITAVEHLEEIQMNEDDTSKASKPKEESTEESTVEKEESTMEKEAMCKECGKSEDECKCAEGGFDRKAAKKETEESTEESSQEIGEESSQEIGEESSREGGVAGVAGKSSDARLTRIEEMLTVLLSTQQEIAKSLNHEEIAKSVQEVTERLSVVEKTASSNGPARAAVGEPNVVVNENLAKSASYRRKAMLETNPKMAQGYLALALEIENSL